MFLDHVAPALAQTIAYLRFRLINLNAWTQSHKGFSSFVSLTYLIYSQALVYASTQMAHMPSLTRHLAPVPQVMRARIRCVTYCVLSTLTLASVGTRL